MSPADTVAMGVSLLIFPILVPLLFWAAYHYYHDRHRPEPLGNLLVCIALGIAAAYLNRGMYLALDEIGLRYDALALARDNLPALFAYAVLGIGLTEELAKLLPFVFVVLHFRAFDEPLDGIIYGSFIALGFSLVENLHYAQFLSPLEIAARGFAGPLVHIVFASVWSYHVGLAKLQGQQVWRSALKWLIITAVVHGIYDFIVLGFSSQALVVAAALIVSVWLWRLRVLKHLSAASQQTPSTHP